MRHSPMPFVLLSRQQVAVPKALFANGPFYNYHERMPPDSRRRSSRIPKQLAIFLIGSDIEGRVFSEETKTVVLSRHGAGITSQYKLSAEQEIIIRSVDSGKEADARVVGQIGSEGDTYIYGVAFLDPTIDFWGLDFGDLTDAEKEASRALLQCSNCQLRETVDHSDLEADVFAINRSAVRYCKRCGSSTVWKQATGEPPASPAPAPAKSTMVEQSVAEAETDDVDVTDSAVQSESPDAEPVVASRPPQRLAPKAWTPPKQEPPALSASKSATSEVSATSPAAPQITERPEDRRKHPRAPVKFKACIRRPGMPDDVVSCEDMSRGGLRFKSKKQYFASTMIEVAVPYSPGGQSIFVPAQIVYVHESPGEGVFHCGVAYIKSSR
jgi:hypothetical protein